MSRKAEKVGFGCLWFNETKHDPFVQLALAAAGTSKALVGSSIALAFTRSPTSIAYAAWDIQRLSKGRLVLGLGTQVKGHIERRFGMKWESPARKMKEEVAAIRAIWKTWQEGVPLDFTGRFFRLDLMTPFFSPGPIEHPRIPVYVAGVNAAMCRLAGAACDGLHVHPLHTTKYLREVVVPALKTGALESGRKRDDLSVTASVFAAVGEDEREVAKMKEVMRGQVAFYASTRTYRRLMELHGWGGPAAKLHELSSRGDWGLMAAEVTDEMMKEFAVEGSWKDMPSLLKSRYGGLVDRVRLYRPFDDSKGWRHLVDEFRP